MSYLLDTNVISELVKTKAHQGVIHWIASIPQNSLYISVLTIGEVRNGIELLNDEIRKQKLKFWLETELTNWFNENILPINIDVAERWGKLLGKVVKPVPAIDSLLAATALHHDLCLVTRNSRDFQYPELEVFNPWEK